MTDPIDVLLEDHRQIMVPIHNLRRVVESLASRGDAALPEARSVLGEAALMMTTRLLEHAHKEDEALFPALERSFASNSGPTAVMREEHREIEARAQLFKRTLHQLEHVEHPAILAGGSELRAMASGEGDAAQIAALARELIDLLDAHFSKEETILFPMARQMLSADDLAAVGRRMDALRAV